MISTRVSAFPVQNGQCRGFSLFYVSHSNTALKTNASLSPRTPNSLPPACGTRKPLWWCCGQFLRLFCSQQGPIACEVDWQIKEEMMATMKAVITMEIHLHPQCNSWIEADDFDRLLGYGWLKCTSSVCLELHLEYVDSVLFFQPFPFSLRFPKVPQNIFSADLIEINPLTLF